MSNLKKDPDLKNKTIHRLLTQLYSLEKKEIYLLDSFEERIKILGWHTKEVVQLVNLIKTINKTFLVEDSEKSHKKTFPKEPKKIKEYLQYVIKKIDKIQGKLKEQTKSFEQVNSEFKWLAQENMIMSEMMQKEKNIYQKALFARSRITDKIAEDFRREYYANSKWNEISKMFKEDLLDVREALSSQKTTIDFERKILTSLKKSFTDKLKTGSMEVIQIDSQGDQLIANTQKLDAEIRKEKDIFHDKLRYLLKEKKDFYSKVSANLLGHQGFFARIFKKKGKGKKVSTEELKEIIRTFSSTEEYRKWFDEILYLQNQGILNITKQQNKLLLRFTKGVIEEKERRNEIIRKEFKQIANLDLLTKLHRREYLMYKLNGEIKRQMFSFIKKMKEEEMSEHKNPKTIEYFKKKCHISLLLLDIDHFKLFNDNYASHEAGDLTLAFVAQKLIESKHRDFDMAIRYGGEELILVWVNSEKSKMVIEAERLRRAIEHDSIEFVKKLNILYPPKKDKIKNITVSIGVASWPEDFNNNYETNKFDEQMTKLIKIADNLMYKAKHSGRNKVVAG